MALNMIQRYTHTEVWEIGTDIAPGAAVMSITDEPGVTITGSGDYATSVDVGPYTISGPSGAPGLKPTKGTVATDGAFSFDVAGASATTPGNTLVYAVGAGAVPASLTLTAGSNRLFGKVDRFIGESSATQTSVWIGASF